MIIITDMPLKEMEFWSGAKAITDRLTEDEFDLIEDSLMSAFPEGLTMTEINDIFWFDDDFICELIGYESFEKFYEERKDNSK